MFCDLRTRKSCLEIRNWQLEIPALRAGLSLIEAVLVIAILAILATVGTISWLGFRGTAELDTAADSIVELATEARGNAISGQDFSLWRIVANNPSSGLSYVTLEQCTDVSCATTVEKRRHTLSSAVEFSKPGDGSSINAIFKQRSGELSDGITKSLEIYSKNNPSQFRIIIIYGTGLVEMRHPVWSISYDTSQTEGRSLVYDPINKNIYAGTAVSNARIYRCDVASRCDSVADWAEAFDPQSGVGGIY